MLYFSVLLIACKKNKVEEPCSAPSTLINLVIKSGSNFNPGVLYRFDSLTITYKNIVFPWSIDSTQQAIKFQLPPEEGVNDTLYLNWWNVPDVDTVVLNYHYDQYTKDCKNLIAVSWFNGESYNNMVSNTFTYIKK